MPAPPPFAAASEAWSLGVRTGEAPEPLQIWPSWGIRGIWLSYTRETKAAAAFIKGRWGVALGPCGDLDRPRTWTQLAPCTPGPQEVTTHLWKGAFRERWGQGGAPVRSWLCWKNSDTPTSPGQETSNKTAFIGPPRPPDCKGRGLERRGGVVPQQPRPRPWGAVLGVGSPLALSQTTPRPRPFPQRGARR